MANSRDSRDPSDHLHTSYNDTSRYHMNSQNTNRRFADREYHGRLQHHDVIRSESWIPASPHRNSDSAPLLVELFCHFHHSIPHTIMSPINRIPMPASSLRNILSHPPRPSHTARALQTTRNYSITKDWKGSPTEAHAKERAKKGDSFDVHAAPAASGMQERDVNEGIADDTKSQGMTERGGRKQAKKAKEEHPAAPEPIIGMNDERAEVCAFFLFLRGGFQILIGLVSQKGDN